MRKSGDLEAQVMEALGNISIPPEFKEWAIKQLKEEHAQEIDSREAATRVYRQSLDNCVRRLDTLINMRLAGEIDQEEYANKREALQAERRKFEDLVADTHGQQDTWLNRAEESFNFAVTAQERFKNGSLNDKRMILSCLGLNLSLKDRKLHIPVEKHLILFQEASEKLKASKIPFEPVGFIGKMKAETAQNEIWGG